jgi:hypothetical protein
MLTADLTKLFIETPGILLSGEAAAELAEDVQAVVIRHVLNSPNRAALETDESFKLAIEDVYNSPFGVTLFNLITLVAFPDKRDVLPSARRAIVEAMIAAMLLEQRQHAPVNVAPQHYGLSPIDIGAFLVKHGLETINTIRQRHNELEAASAAADFAGNGC